MRDRDAAVVRRVDRPIGATIGSADPAGEEIASTRAQPPPRRWAAVALAALVLMSLSVAAGGSEIGIRAGDSDEPDEGAETNAQAQPLDFLLAAEGGGVDTEELLESTLAQLRCAAFQQRLTGKPTEGPRLGEGVMSESEFAPLFQAPEVYRSGIEEERLRALAAQLVGGDPSGALDGSRAAVTGLPSPRAVSGWGSRDAPLIAYVPRTETPFDLKRDMSGAGALVIDGDLHLWGSFRYAGLLVVLGDFLVLENAELDINGLPLFTGELKVFHRGRFRVKAHDAALQIIRRTLAGRMRLARIPVPQIERVQAPSQEHDCPLFGPGM